MEEKMNEEIKKRLDLINFKPGDTLILIKKDRSKLAEIETTSIKKNDNWFLGKMNYRKTFLTRIFIDSPNITNKITTSINSYIYLIDKDFSDWDLIENYCIEHTKMVLTEKSCSESQLKQLPDIKEHTNEMFGTNSYFSDCFIGRDLLRIEGLIKYIK